MWITIFRVYIGKIKLLYSFLIFKQSLHLLLTQLLMVFLSFHKSLLLKLIQILFILHPPSVHGITQRMGGERMYRSIEISREFTRGPHSFRRNGITRVCNASGGNIYLASVLYGNSPQSASKHYYTGINLSEAKALLEGKRKGNRRVTNF